MSISQLHLVVLSLLASVEQRWARALSANVPSTTPPLESYAVQTIRVIPHVGEPFTQGLEITDDGKYLVETSGSYPVGTESFVRLVNPSTGETIRSLKDGVNGKFAEGIVQIPSSRHWFVSTYMDKKVVEYDEDLNFVVDHDFPWMGWGLTRSADGAAFLATNGSEYLMKLNPTTFETLDTKVVTCFGKRVVGLNELEMVDNFMGHGPTLLGNVYLTRLVLAVDPDTARCRGVFHLESLGDKQDNENAGFHVANGLAYNKTSGTLFVTGKNWKEMFEIRLNPDPENVASEMLSNRLVQVRPVSLQAVNMEVSPGADSFLNSPPRTLAVKKLLK
jgi:glutamine cyclotransferase